MNELVKSLKTYKTMNEPLFIKKKIPLFPGKGSENSGITFTNLFLEHAS